MDHRSTGVPFSFFITLLHRISKIKPAANTSKEYPYPALKEFRKWVKELRDQYAPLQPDTAATVLNLLFPDDDAQRKFQLKEKALGVALSKALAVSTERGHRGHRLRTWKNEYSVGCIGAEVYEILSEKSGEVSQDDDIDQFDGPTIAEVNTLVTELASRSVWSDKSIRALSTESITAPRTKERILRKLYSPLRPREAAFVTQIILKDLRPLLYPLPDTNTTAALLHYNSNSVKMLTKEHAMQAWDSSGKLSNIFRVNATLAGAATMVEAGQERIPFGSPVEIPKCQKGKGCKSALARLSASKKVWAETKYDGERAQIHIQVNWDGEVDIKIVSKSGRDSTQDRHGIHPIIRQALGLASEAGNLSSRNQRRPDGNIVIKSVVVEAEMVAFDDVRGCVDEFWRIRSLVDTSAIGARKYLRPRPSARIEEDSQSSLISSGSDDGTRHLALVFFDALMINGEYLLHTPYCERREILESIISPVPGYVILAVRYPISLGGASALLRGEAELRRIFATHIADFEEGLVLKADESMYKDRAFPWVKLKRDYIDGYGDCLDLAIVGGIWDQDRGRNLRVAPQTMTKFYIGVLSNPEALKVGSSTRPHFEVYFTASYGLSRQALDDVNCLFRVSDSTPYGSIEQDPNNFPYTIELRKGLEKPSFLLAKPLLAELYGGGFTKSDNSKYYELRWPRMTKLHRSIERGWQEGATIDEVQQIAHEVIGRDSSDKDVEDIIGGLWGKAVKEGVRSPARRQQSMLKWLANMEAADGAAKSAGVLKAPWEIVQDKPEVKGRVWDKVIKHQPLEEQGPFRIKGVGLPVRSTGLNRLTSMTNVARPLSSTDMAFPLSPPSSPPVVSPRKRQMSGDENDLTEGMLPSPPSVNALVPVSPRKKRRVSDSIRARDPPLPAHSMAPTLCLPTSIPSRSNDSYPCALHQRRPDAGSHQDPPEQNESSKDITDDQPSEPSGRTSPAWQLDPNLRKLMVLLGHPVPLISTSPTTSIPPSPTINDPDTPTSTGTGISTPAKLPVWKSYVPRFKSALDNCLVWLGCPSDHVRPRHQRPDSDVIPDHRLIHNLEAFLLGCGWGTDMPDDFEVDESIEHGFIFVDGGTVRGYETWVDKEYAVGLLEERLQSGEVLPEGVRKPICIIDARILNYGELEKRWGRFEQLILACYE